MAEVVRVRARGSSLGETWLRVTGDEVVLDTQPALSRARSWRFPLTGVAVVNLSGFRDPLNPVDAGLFADGVRLPSIMAPLRLPNLGLLLVEPYAGGPGEEHAELHTGAGARYDGRPAGYWIDGVLMAVDNPAITVATLADAGVQVVTDPTFWLAARRRGAEPSRLARAAAVTEAARQGQATSRLVVAAGMAIVGVGLGSTPWLIAAGLAVAAIGAVRRRGPG
jgi:hypothetical protein